MKSKDDDKGRMCSVFTFARRFVYLPQTERTRSYLRKDSTCMVHLGEWKNSLRLNGLCFMHICSNRMKGFRIL